MFGLKINKLKFNLYAKHDWGGGGKARKLSDRVGEGLRGGVSPPMVGRFFFLCVCIKMAFFAH